VIYLLHGDDDFSIGETVTMMRGRLREEDPAGADFNTTELDGRRLTVGDLEAAASALPFMGPRRLVVVRGMVERCNPKGGESGAKDLAQSLVAYLPNVPDSTRLVFADAAAHGNNPVRKWLEGQSKKGEEIVVRAFDPPKAATLPRWLERRAQAKDGRIEPAAATALASALADDGSGDLRQADNELEKLLTYAGDRAVTAEDVTELVAPVGQESIFRLVDALADRDGRIAATLLHQFLTAGEPPLRIMALVARQMRLLTMARGMIDAGADTRALQSRLPVPPFVVTKLQRQARRFSLEGLVLAMERLAAMDEDIKTGEMDPVTSLDLFVASLCGSPSRGV
jgi:DNA polymerase-3 subunit delta